MGKGEGSGGLGERGTYFTPAPVLLEGYGEGSEEKVEYTIDKADISHITES